ncbi:hypothetical protein J7E70_02360 [Variovorax paradoxus]|nr:hypothetical protein [Variovorax paradoxus]MBT2299296.1 hypothetical protein [Variovorax paradoxus]
MKQLLLAFVIALLGHAHAETLGPEWIKVAKEGAAYTLVPKRIVKYGAEGKFVQKTLQGTFRCDNATFGDPAAGAAKACFAKSPGYVPPEGEAPAKGAKLAEQDGPFQVGAPTIVSYGRATTIGGQYTRDSARVEKVVSGEGVCSTPFFGKDPAAGFAKNCVSYGPAEGAPPPAPPTGTGGVSGDIVDSTGAVVASAYVSMAFKYGQAEGITYRYGAPASKAGVPTLPLRGDVGSISHCGGAEGCKVYYQLGRENTAADNLYVSTHGAAIGTPEVGNSVTNAVAWFQAQATDRETWMQRPQLLWQDRTLTPPSIRDYVAAGALALNSAASLPIAEKRCESSADSPCRMSLVATQGSATEPATLFTVGTYTAQQRASVTFALGKVPTAISITSMSEFALVTVWDTINLKGQIAVVALGGVPSGRTWENTTNWYDWWHDWTDGAKPGFPNQGGIGFMKVVGYVDLPANMKAPTAINVTTGSAPFDMVVHPVGKEVSSIGALGSPLASNRAKFLPGGEFYEKYAKGGVAVVVSKSEKTVAFVDLGPLFTYFNSMYLDSAASNLETQKLGMGAKQWPYLLAEQLQAMPRVAKVITLASKPAGVQTTATYSHWSKDDRARIPGTPYWQTTPHYPRAWVATQDGSLLIFSLGRYAAGPKPTTPDPADIAQVGTVSGLGNNITFLSASKGYPGEDNPLNEMTFFTARGDRAWGWVKFSANQNSGSVIRKMADSRVDPIVATEADQYSTEGGIVSVADYAGKRIANYRYGPVIYPRPASQTTFCPQPTGCATLTSEGEYAGALDLPFKPFSVHSSNVP